MSASDALPRSVLTRKAVVHVRQSTPQQMWNNLESQRRQYDLVNVAHGHGFARVSPKSRLGEKLAYIARHRDGLQLFLADGRIEMDSNSVENLARLIALNRKKTRCSPATTSARAHGAASPA